jgi:hypothetical protein
MKCVTFFLAWSCTDMTDTANLALNLMMIFFALLALATVVTLCGLPAILRSFDADLAKLDSHL